MISMIISYKFRLLLTSHQKTLLKKQFRRCELAYSKVCERALQSVRTGGSLPSWFDLCNYLSEQKKTSPELKETNAQVLQDIAHRAHRHLVECLIRKQTQLKEKTTIRLITYPQFGKGCRFKDDGVYFDKIGVLKFKSTREILGKIKTASIKQDELDKWFVIFACELNVVGELPPAVRNPVGIDFGITRFVTLSDGTSYQYPKTVEQTRTALFRAAGKLRQAGTRKEQSKIKKRILHLKMKHRNLSEDFINKLCNRLIESYDGFYVENISKTGMQKGRGLGARIHMTPWKKFSEQLKSKCRLQGRAFVYVDPRNTSRECSACGNVKDSLKLQERIYECAKCGSSLCRDINAARVILKRGMAS